MKVNGIVFAADFYIQYIEDEISTTLASIHKGTLTMEFNGEVNAFNIFDGEMIT